MSHSAAANSMSLPARARYGMVTGRSPGRVPSLLCACPVATCRQSPDAATPMASARRATGPRRGTVGVGDILSVSTVRKTGSRRGVSHHQPCTLWPAEAVDCATRRSATRRASSPPDCGGHLLKADIGVIFDQQQVHRSIVSAPEPYNDADWQRSIACTSLASVCSCARRFHKRGTAEPRDTASATSSTRTPASRAMAAISRVTRRSYPRAPVLRTGRCVRCGTVPKCRGCVVTTTHIVPLVLQDLPHDTAWQRHARQTE